MPKKPTNEVNPLKPLLARLSPRFVEQISDAQVKQAVSDTVTLATEVSKAYSGSGTTERADAERLQGVGLTPAKVFELLSAAAALADATADRVEKEALFHEAVAAVSNDRTKLENQLSNVAALLRGAYGTTSPEVKRFGFRPLGGGHNGGRKKDSADPSKKDAAKP